MEQLTSRLTEDLLALNIPVDEVELFMRPYSSTYYGRYFPVYDDNKAKPKLFIYPYSSEEDLYPYGVILEIAIHEMVHHIQHTSGSFVRLRGVMHNPNFWQLYNHYKDRAVRLGLMEECNEKLCSTV